MTVLLRSLACLAVLSLAVACSVEVPAADAGAFACRGPSDCNSGYDCHPTSKTCYKGTPPLTCAADVQTACSARGLGCDAKTTGDHCVDCRRGLCPSGQACVEGVFGPVSSQATGMCLPDNCDPLAGSCPPAGSPTGTVGKCMHVTGVDRALHSVCVVCPAACGTCSFNESAASLADALKCPALECDAGNLCRLEESCISDTMPQPDCVRQCAAGCDGNSTCVTASALVPKNAPAGTLPVAVQVCKPCDPACHQGEYCGAKGTKWSDGVSCVKNCTPADCRNPTPICDATSGRCVECDSGGTTCPGGVCVDDPTNTAGAGRRCVTKCAAADPRCAAGSACVNAMPVGSSAATNVCKTCVGCVSSAPCVSGTGNPDNVFADQPVSCQTAADACADAMQVAVADAAAAKVCLPGCGAATVGQPCMVGAAAGACLALPKYNGGPATVLACVACSPTCAAGDACTPLSATALTTLRDAQSAVTCTCAPVNGWYTVGRSACAGGLFPGDSVVSADGPPGLVIDQRGTPWVAYHPSPNTSGIRVRSWDGVNRQWSQLGTTDLTSGSSVPRMDVGLRLRGDELYVTWGESGAIPHVYIAQTSIVQPLPTSPSWVRMGSDYTGSSASNGASGIADSATGARQLSLAVASTDAGSFAAWTQGGNAYFSMLYGTNSRWAGPSDAAAALSFASGVNGVGAPKIVLASGVVGWLAAAVQLNAGALASLHAAVGPSGGTGWQSVAADAESGVGWVVGPDLATSASGQVHMAYGVGGTAVLKVVRLTGTALSNVAWSPVSSTASNPANVALAMNGDEPIVAITTTGPGSTVSVFRAGTNPPALLGGAALPTESSAIGAKAVALAVGASLATPGATAACVAWIDGAAALQVYLRCHDLP